MTEDSEKYRRAARKRGRRMGVMQENLEAVEGADAKGFHLLAYLLAHSTIESNLRGSVGRPQSDVRFCDLIEALRDSPRKLNGKAALVRDLCTLNTFRNKLVHELWTDGFGRANGEAKRRGPWALGVTLDRTVSVPTRVAGSSMKVTAWEPARAVRPLKRRLTDLRRGTRSRLAGPGNEEPAGGRGPGPRLYPALETSSRARGSRCTCGEAPTWRLASLG